MNIHDILSEENIALAMEHLQSRRDSCGGDGVNLSELQEYWELNGKKITELILDRNYEPGLVVKKEIVSTHGKPREIALINSVDRLLLRAMAQKISPFVDDLLSDSVYAYRPDRGTKAAAEKAASYIEAGLQWVAEIDIRHYFDSISPDELFRKLQHLLSDEKVLALIKAYLFCRVECEGETERLSRGLLQGSSLSPVLANYYLVDLDRRVDAERLSFIRFGDDIRLYCASREEAEERKRFVELILQEEGLEINVGKSGVFPALNRPCLGYEFLEKDGHVFICRASHIHREVYDRWISSSIRKVHKRYHLVNSGVLTRRDYTILFENEEGKRYLPVGAVDSINIFSDITISGNFLEYISKNKIQLSFIDKSGEYIGSFVPAEMRQDRHVEAEQILLLENEKEHLKLAQRYQKANIHNLRAILRYYERREQEESEISMTIAFLTEILEKLEKAESINTLMMLEAQGRQRYYRCFNEIMKDEGFLFKTRTRRPPQDALNAMISFGNTLLYRRIANEIRMSALSIRYGIIHNSQTRPESLNLDIADLFKPVLVDRTIFTLVNKKMISAVRDFRQEEDGGVYLNDNGKRIFLAEYEKKLQQKIDVRGQQKTYDMLIHDEVKKLERFFRKKQPYKPYKYVN